MKYAEHLTSALVHGSTCFKIVDFNKVAAKFPKLARSPRTIKIICEALLRRLGDAAACPYVTALLDRNGDFPFFPNRVIMQDYSGVPALLDVMVLRDLAISRGLDPKIVQLACRVDLVVDHSVQVKFLGPGAAAKNLNDEYYENEERFSVLRWAEREFDNFKVVPPGNGIVHQINLERLGNPIVAEAGWAYPDSVLGTDSHTPMINASGILGWGVGGIEAVATMLGLPQTMTTPNVVGIRLTGMPPSGVLATDLALRLSEFLRKRGVVNCFLEFYGTGVSAMSLPDRATVANMTPEYGATCAMFPIDKSTIAFLERTGRSKQAELAQYYARHQRIWSEDDEAETVYDDVLEFNLASMVRTVSGPSLPHQTHNLFDVSQQFPIEKSHSGVSDGDIVLAAITSCTNTSNPAAMVAAGLLAKKAVDLGLKLSERIKASFSPGSRSVELYLEYLGLLSPLHRIGFWTVGYGCMTCVGNSGELSEVVSRTITAGDLNVAAILSGNRNFEGRIHPKIRSNFLASPPLVVAYAIAGTMRIDLDLAPLGEGYCGPVYLRDIWPTPEEIQHELARIPNEVFNEEKIVDDKRWKSLIQPQGDCFPWPTDSTYLVRPSVVMDAPGGTVLARARPLLILGDTITTDHISPVGRISADSSAGQYLMSLGVTDNAFNTYGARRGNAEVMRRGTFASDRINNVLSKGRLGSWSTHFPSGSVLNIFEASERYKEEGIPMIVVAGEQYGTGSARDWAAKGTRELGIKVVLARSFERIHRANLALVGVMPIELSEHLQLNGDEMFSIAISPDSITPKCDVSVEIQYAVGSTTTIEAKCRLDTQFEVDCWRLGGVIARAACNIK